MRNCSTIVSIYSIKDGSQEMLCGDRGVLCPSCRELRARDKLAEEREKDQLNQLLSGAGPAEKTQ